MSTSVLSRQQSSNTASSAHVSREKKSAFRTYIFAKYLSYQFEGSEAKLFDGISLSLGSGIQCLVGRNGCGKSVLAAILAGVLSPTSGQVIAQARVGYLSQGIVLDEQTVAELLGLDALHNAWTRVQAGECHDADMNLLDGHWDFEQKAIDVLAPFGFDVSNSIGDFLARTVEEFSGGEQTKLRLARLSLSGCEVMVLDEPSNHLDAQSREQLYTWLQKQKSVFVVSHDRELLSLASDIYELIDGELRRTRGNYEVYLEAREQRLHGLAHQEQVANQQLQQAKRKHAETAERAARKTKQGALNRKQANQSKLILDKAKETSEATQSAKAKIAQRALSDTQQQLQAIKAQKDLLDPLSFHVAPPKQSRGVVLQLDDLSLPYVDMAPLSLNVAAGEKLAVVGNNGSGKSTLLKVIAGQLMPTHGEIRRPACVRYLDQHFALLSPYETALENFERLAPGFTETQYRTILAQLRLRREKALYPVAHLSGGERLKVALACLFFGEYSPDLLLLDEPDNHLDLESKQLLEQTLKQYSGALMLVSHDATFIQHSGIETLLDLNVL